MFAGSCHNIILQLQSAQAREAVQAHPNNARTVFHPTVNFSHCFCAAPWIFFVQFV